MDARNSGLPTVGVSILVGLLCASSSCSVQEPNDYSPPIAAVATSAVIGPNGGTVTAGDGTSVDIPAGALTQEVTITITANPYAPALTQAQPLWAAHLFEPEDQDFLMPVTISLPFNTADFPAGGDASLIKIYSAPNGSTSYIAIERTGSNGTFVIGTTSKFCNMVPGIDVSGGKVLL